MCCDDGLGGTDPAGPQNTLTPEKIDWSNQPKRYVDRVIESLWLNYLQESILVIL